MSYETAFARLMDVEGWHSNDKLDSGGDTLLGVTVRWYPAIHEAIRKAYIKGGMDAAIAVASEFYRVEFWDRLRLDNVDEDCAEAMLLFAVNAGHAQAIRLAHRVMKMRDASYTGIDGWQDADSRRFGDITMQQPENSLGALRTQIGQHYTGLVQKNPASNRWLWGWMRRLGG